MTNNLIIDKNYYINFLIKLYRERNWHEDFQDLNKKKLEILNKYLGLDGFVNFDFEKKRFKFNPLETINISKIKDIKGYSKFNDFKNQSDLNNFVSYIEMYFNELIGKLTKEDIRIHSGIELCTNDTNEFIKKLMNSYNKDLIISSHIQQIKLQYKEALESLFDVLYVEDYMNIINGIDSKIQWNIEITNINDINDLKYSLDEYEYL